MWCERERESEGERARKGASVLPYFHLFPSILFAVLVVFPHFRLHTSSAFVSVCMFFIRFFSSIRFNSNGICNSIFYCYILVVVVLCRRRPPQRSRRRRRRRTRSRIDCRI